MSTKHKWQKDVMLTDTPWSPRYKLSHNEEEYLYNTPFLTGAMLDRYSRFGHNYLYLIIDPGLTDQDYFDKVKSCPQIAAVPMKTNVRHVLRTIKRLVADMKCDSDYDYSGARLQSISSIGPDSPVFEVAFDVTGNGADRTLKFNREEGHKTHTTHKSQSHKSHKSHKSPSFSHGHGTVGRP